MNAQTMERHQVPLYVLAILVGAALGLAVPSIAGPLELSITPVLAVLLYVTFLAVPFTSIGQAFRSARFVVALLVLNFIAAPAMAFALSRFVADEQALLLGVLFVLLTPCVDYVIVFAGLAGGDTARLVAATPLRMLAQILLLPVYLALFVGPRGLASAEPEPFIEAFVWLIMLPLAVVVGSQVHAPLRFPFRFSSPRWRS